MSSTDTAPLKAMIKPIIIMVLAVVLVLGAIFGVQRYFGGMFKKNMAAAASQPQTVSTIEATTSEWQPFIQSTGTLRAVRGADLSAQASRRGRRDFLRFGQRGHRRQGLLRLKPNDDYAKLQQLQAAAELARADI